MQKCNLSVYLSKGLLLLLLLAKIYNNNSNIIYAENNGDMLNQQFETELGRPRYRPVKISTDQTHRLHYCAPDIIKYIEPPYFHGLFFHCDQMYYTYHQYTSMLSLHYTILQSEKKIMKLLFSFYRVRVSSMQRSFDDLLRCNWSDERLKIVP